MPRSNPYEDLAHRKQFYESELVAEVPRLLSGLDRCPLSATRGSLDREFWAWATKDFSNIDLQRGIRVLAYLYVQDFPVNTYYRERSILNWIAHAIAFWAKNQYSDGSFNHLYVNERSWMATAFTLLDMVDVWRAISHEIPSVPAATWLDAMNSAGWFLVNHDELHGFISNHRAGAAGALAGLHSITGESAFSDRAWQLMDEVYDRQSSEGWFLEYEGADPGYQTLDTHYQSVFYLETGSDRVLEAVSRSLGFLSYFVHPDGSIGGEYGSRSCPHFFPGGFEVFASKLPLAEAIAGYGTMGLAARRSAGLADSDTRNRVPLATSYVLAHQALTLRLEQSQNASVSEPPDHIGLPLERDFERLWPEAGLYVRSDRRTYLVFGASKGGVIKCFSKETCELVHASCGYAGVLADGRHITTHLWTTSPALVTQGLEKGKESPLGTCREVQVTARFFHFSTLRIMTPLRFFLFRIFNLSIGRVRLVNDFVRKHLIIGRFLKKRTGVPLTLERKLILEDRGEVRVEDEISGRVPEGVAELREYGYLSSVFMASAKYYRPQDMRQDWIGDDLARVLRTDFTEASSRLVVQPFRTASVDSLGASNDSASA